MNTVFQKYATAILSLSVLLLGAVGTALHGTVSAVDILQLVILFLGGIVTYIVPLLPGGWSGGLKTGVGIAAAAVALVIPYVTQGSITTAQILLVVVGVIQAAATQLGVAIRIDGKLALK